VLKVLAILRSSDVDCMCRLPFYVKLDDFSCCLPVVTFFFSVLPVEEEAVSMRSGQLFSLLLLKVSRKMLNAAFPPSDSDALFL